MTCTGPRLYLYWTLAAGQTQVGHSEHNGLKSHRDRYPSVHFLTLNVHDL